MIHKGWWFIFRLVVIQVGLGYLIFFSLHDDNESGDSETETVTEVDDSNLPFTGELVFLPAALLPDTEQPDEGNTVCVRVCAVPTANAPLLSGACSAPLSIIASVDDEEGENWLAANIPAASSKTYHPFLAAADRRLLVLDKAQCQPEEATDPLSDGVTVEVNDEA